MNHIISVLNDFSEDTGLRHCSISDKSGEEFYHKILNNAFTEAYRNKEKLTINLDNTSGYSPSFLDEAFGNLIFDFGEAVVKQHIKIISTEEPSWIEMIEEQTYPQWEERRTKKQTPKITEKHNNWFCLEEGTLISKKCH